MPRPRGRSPATSSSVSSSSAGAPKPCSSFATAPTLPEGRSHAGSRPCKVQARWHMKDGVSLVFVCT